MKKIIQIAVSETKLTTTVVALLSDGSLWWTLLWGKGGEVGPRHFAPDC